MATKRVGVYRKWHGPIPTNASGKPLPPTEWHKKRLFSWAVRWFGIDGKRYSKSFRNRKEAETFAETKQVSIWDGKGADPPPEITLREYRKEHEEVMKGNVAASTLALHLKALDLLAEHAGWDRPLHKVSVRDVERFRAARLAKGLAASSVNREIRSLKRLFNLAVVRGYLGSGQNPCLALTRLKVARTRPAYCTPEHFEAIVRQAPDALWRAFLAVVYTSGLRLRDALNLTWGDIDFQNGHVDVSRKEGDGFIQPWQPKDHERRTVPLPDEAIALLAKWQAEAPEGCPYVFMEAARWEFYRQRLSEKAWRTGQDLVNNQLRRFKTICRRAGVGPYTIHDLRRSCITNWAQRLPIHVVQKLAGHSDINTTETYYLSVQSEDLANARRLQSELVGDILADSGTDPLLTHFDSKGNRSSLKRCFPQTRRTDGKL
jgi:integrase/recombinase XerD